MASLFSKRSYGSLPSNIEKNPREEVKAITLRNGWDLKKPEKNVKEEVLQKKIVESPKLDEFESSKASQR